MIGLYKDKRGDAMLVFIAMLILIFGILVINFTGVVQTSAMRQKIYNAVQDGLTIAMGKSLTIDGKKLIFNEDDARNRVLKSLINNKIEVTGLQVWYSNNRIYASGTATINHLGVDTSTTSVIPFKYYIDVHRDFR